MARKKAGPRVVGIDPSISSTGIAFADGSTSVVKDKKYEGDRRLIHLYASVLGASALSDFVAIEDLPANSMGAGLTARSQGVVRLALQSLSVPYIALPAATVKRSGVGKGNATKADMVAGVPEDLGITDDNAADAWWLRQCGLHLMGQESLLADPSALDKYITEEVVALREVWS